MQNRDLLNILLILALVVMSVSLADSILPQVRTQYEMLTLGLFPSAERAYSYGERHFSSPDRNSYDLDHAEYFFRKARHLDPQHPLVNHEIARIYFLRGSLETALDFINSQIRYNGDVLHSFYVRGLILGYMGRYSEAARDYERYLVSDPTNWAAVNDYAWVLLKAGRPREAAVASASALLDFPDNPWLLNTHAIALYELGEFRLAREKADAALLAVRYLSEEDWLRAYPGNDPKTADEGIQALRDAITGNVHTILVALGEEAV